MEPAAPAHLIPSSQITARFNQPDDYLMPALKPDPVSSLTTAAITGAVMRKSTIALGLVGTTFVLGACSLIPRPGPVGNNAVPPPAKPIDIERYMGRWYEQFRYETSFQNDMDGVMAEYSLSDDGTVRVVNRGLRNGNWKQSVGKAKIVDSASKAKLKVSFFRPFYGNYWILDHGEEYEWSIVGEPSGRYLWVLTREPRPGTELLEELKSRVEALGYDWALVRKTQQ